MPVVLPDLGCKRVLIRVSRPYQKNVCSLIFRLQTQNGYAYQNRVCSSSSYLRRLLPPTQCFDATRLALIRSLQVQRAPAAAPPAPAAGMLPGSGRQS
jgi:hypothetical protein